MQQHSHEPIVSAKTFDEAQAELARRRRCGKRWSGTGIFSSRIVCGECGGFYGPKVWHSTNTVPDTVKIH